jgi:acetyl-CoA carboxylase carboxyltransferase component
MLGEKPRAGFDRIEAIAPKKNPEELYGLFPHDGKPYDVMDIIKCIVDDSEFRTVQRRLW